MMRTVSHSIQMKTILLLSMLTLATGWADSNVPGRNQSNEEELIANHQIAVGFNSQQVVRAIGMPTSVISDAYSGPVAAAPPKVTGSASWFYGNPTNLVVIFKNGRVDNFYKRSNP